ncbi:MAG: hypothetical protein ACT4TC_00300 [Myxococcaceae bacterium]
MRLGLLASVVASLLLVSPAQARFGKRSNDSDDSPPPARDHAASSPGYEPPPSQRPGYYRPGPGYYGGPGRGYRARRWYDGPRYRRYGFGYWYAPPPPVYMGPPYSQQQQEPDVGPPSVTAALGAEAQAVRGGATLGLNFNLEGERLGVAVQFTGILIGTDDGTSGFDSIKLFNGELTYAFLATDRVRVRVEGGLHSAFAPDLTAVGPGIGLSAGLHLAGPVGLEAAARVTPFPFRQLDASGALTVSVGVLGFKAGWRHILLDDAGLVDGVPNVDSFSGPFIGVALLL